MNSHQRREVRRALEKAGVISDASRQTNLKAQPEPPQDRQQSPPIWEKASRIPRRLWQVVIAGATLASLLGFGVFQFWPPKISIEPYALLDPQSPFTEQFYIQNDNFYAIDNVVPHCYPLRVMTTMEGGIRGFSLGSATEITEHLLPGAKTNATCPTSGIFRPKDKFLQPFTIYIWVTYELPFHITRCTGAAFSGKEASGQTYMWTYQGGGHCPKGWKTGEDSTN